MYKLRMYLQGTARILLCCAEPVAVLNRLTEMRIAYWQIEYLDGLRVEISIFDRDRAKVQAILEQLGGTAERQTRLGLPQILAAARRRITLLVLLTTGVLLVSILQHFVFFFSVTGCEQVPAVQILRELEEIGVKPGIPAAAIKPQKIKDRLLRRIPELEWVTVTQSGCCGEIVVRERIPVPETEDRRGYAHVIASRSGTIVSQQVYAGQPQFHVGDSVLKGEVLVSGLVDLERIYTLEHANAEIFAETQHDFEIVTPQRQLRQTTRTKAETAVFLRLGRKRIKIFGNSGIHPPTYDKIITTMNVALPGNLELPLGLELEQCVCTAVREETLSADEARMWMIRHARTCTEQVMCAGQILQEDFRFTAGKPCYTLSARLRCREMIAEVVEAKWENEDFVHG